MPIVPRSRRPENLSVLQLLPNLVTILGLCAGLTALRFAFDDKFEPAVALLIFAALIDGLDGLLARKLNAASNFGAELDSLSDFLNFGVAPALIVYQMLLSETANVAWTAALVFAVCACLRLARFNVNRDMPVVGRVHFVGVPAPAGALLGLLPVFAVLAGFLTPGSASWLVGPWLCFVGFLMISRVRTFAPKGLRISRNSARWLLVSVALLVGVTFSQFWLLMVFIDVAYLGSLLYSLATRKRPRPPAAAGE